MARTRMTSDAVGMDSEQISVGSTLDVAAVSTTGNAAVCSDAEAPALAPASAAGERFGPHVPGRAPLLH